MRITALRLAENRSMGNAEFNKNLYEISALWPSASEKDRTYSPQPTVIAENRTCPHISGMCILIAP
jgi:hypothetical protein